MVVRSIAFAALALAASSSIASAATQVCGGDVSVTGTVSGYINPFSPTGTTVSATINVARTVLIGQSARTKDFYFYFVPHSGTFPTGSTITYTGTNILNLTGTTWTGLNDNQGNPAGTISVESATGGSYLHVGFGTSDVTESYPVTLLFSVGIFANEAAGLQTLPLDIVFECKGTGSGVGSVDTPTLQSSGAAVMLNVLSGLQATYAGPALDFGPIGGQNSGGATVSGAFDVKSSGVFSVDLSSDNKFLLTYSGGPTTPGTGTVSYKLGFLNQFPAYPSTGITQVTCSPVGVSTFVNLPIQAKLLEGGMGKTPANYSDNLTVTFTPLAAATPDPSNTCQALSDTVP